jgi:ATP-dependent Clp protease ATP-binding subunit ClpC
MKEIVDRELKRHFRPEFINRVDDAIVFEPLSAASMLEVAWLLLEESAENLGRRRVRIEYDRRLADWLVERCGLDPQSGARPLRRLVQVWIEDPVADFLIEHYPEGSVELRVVLGDERPQVEVVNAVSHAEEKS